MNEPSIIPNATTTRRDLIPAAWILCVELKMLGCRYETIAEKTGYSLAHVKWLFSKSGALYPFWREWQEEATKAAMDDSMSAMFGNLSAATRALCIEAQKPGMSGNIARKMLMEYTLGKPEDTVNLRGAVAVGTIADFVRELNDKRLRENPDGMAQ